MNLVNKYYFTRLILVIIVLIPLGTFSQDIITRTNGTIINAKVGKVSKTTIEYSLEVEKKIYDFSIPVADVYSILYSDGNLVYYSERLSIEDKDSDLQNKEFDENTYPNDPYLRESEKDIKYYFTTSFSNSYPLFKQVLGENINRSKIDNESSKQTDRIFGTYGKGYSWGAGAGVMIRNDIGIELSYLHFTGKGLSNENSNLNSSTDINNKWSVKENTLTQTHAGFQSLNGSMLLKYKWLYSRLGVMAAKAIISVDSSYSRTYQNLPLLRDSIRTSSTQLVSNNFQLGFIGGVGFQMPIGEHISLFSEANFMMLNFLPDKMKYISVTEQGKDKKNPEDLPLKDETNTSDNNNLRRNYPINNWGWNVGLLINF